MRTSYLCLIAFVLVLIAAVFVFERSSDKALQMTDKVSGMIDRFQTRKVETTYREYLVAIKAEEKLQIAALNTQQEIQAQDSYRILWNLLDLGTTTIRIRIPATYRFYVDLSHPEDWTFEPRDGVLCVIAPQVHPFLPVAFDSAGVEKEGTQGWARFNLKEKMAQAEKEISRVLEANAEQHLQTVRDQCRMAVGVFIKRWLVQEEVWSGKGFQGVKVVFRDESKDWDAVAPTIRD